MRRKARARTPPAQLRPPAKSRYAAGGWRVARSEAVEKARVRRAGSRRTWARAGLAIALLIVTALAVAWLARAPIASRFIDRSLAERHVPATYRIADLGFGRQRLENVVIGDPASPDLIADWIETRTEVRLSGARLVGVRAGRVRMRGRLVDGRLSLGALDRLLAPPSGKPFVFPAIDLDIADGRMRLGTPWGLLRLRLTGRGRLDGGFRGTLAAAGDRLATEGCAARGVTAALEVGIVAQPTLAGPVRADAIACGGVRAGRTVAMLAATLSPRMNAARGSATVRAAEFSAGAARGDMLAIEGDWSAGERSAFEGAIRAHGVAIDPAVRARLAALASSADGSPLAPSARELAHAVVRAAAGFDVEARGTVVTGPFAFRATALKASSASGARLELRQGALAGSADGVAIDGVIAVTGGGLPDARVSLVQRGVGAPLAGTLAMSPYRVGDAALALSSVRFGGGFDEGHAAAVAVLTGPLGGGRVEALSLPLDARWRKGWLTLNPQCAPLAFRKLTIAGLRLDPARLALCPAAGAMLRFENGSLSGGVRIAATELKGRLGASPMTLAIKGADVSLDRRGFALRELSARLGEPAHATRLSFARVDGRLRGGDVTGAFAGGSGRIGKAPLLLSDAAGQWRLSGGVLGIGGELVVSDADAQPRFTPLNARGVTLRLADNVIEAEGTLHAPKSGTLVADVSIRHALTSGTGAADLRVPGLALDEKLQPDDLTRFTYGVVADVKGSVSGEARIAWSPERVSSTGTFRTADMDLAAAFGPVTGLSTEIRFTDLLSLESAPGQIATVATVNPGVPVEDGRITYQTLPESRVAIGGGRWPFAGGTLTLEPTLLDFSAEQTRRLTFRVAGMEAGKFLQTFHFDNLSATGTFDGVLPMVFDPRGGRIENGSLVVGPGGGTIAYVGELTRKDLGFWGDLAFQSLRSLRYKNLNVVMNGPLAGEMVAEVRFAGVSQGEGAKSNFLIRRLQRLPLVFNVTIKAPFRGLIDSVRSFHDPNRLIERNLPALIEEQNRRVQPGASGAPAPSKD